MINRIKALILGSGGSGDAGAGEDGDGGDATQVAAVALLVEAAVMDGDFDDGERRTIARLVGRQFGLEAAAVEDLIRAGEEAVDASSQLYAFTRVVKEGFDFEQRVRMIEMLWEVAYADGELHDFEASLVRRVSGLIHVTDRESGMARGRVLKRLGLKV
ncbi:MAG: TerB family tellurite resistance protein [Proteobacteria bacterium]|nr:TerB family tellurite resistance protein [Pseudomonadota bacterium]